MPALIDPRQEAFAQARARGAHRLAAAAEAGYRDNGSKLAKRPHVVARVAELQENIALVRRADHAGTVADLIGRRSGGPEHAGVAELGLGGPQGSPSPPRRLRFRSEAWGGKPGRRHGMDGTLQP
jgi:hypothetical protein